MNRHIFAIDLKPISKLISTITGEESEDLLRKYDALLSHTCLHRGKKEAIAYGKALYSQAVQLALGLEIIPIPFRKSNKYGLDKNLFSFHPYLVGTLNQKRTALTVLRTVYLLFLDPSKETSSITDPPLSSWSLERKRDFRNFLWETQKGYHGTHGRSLMKRFTRKHPAVKVVPRAASGPNGPSSLYSAEYDALALEETGIPRSQFSLLRSLKLDPQLLIDRLQLVRQSQLDKTKEVCTGRLAFLSEGGGKTRIIAIGDIYSQSVLEPIHEECMDRLSTLVNDGTMDQARVRNLIRVQTQRHCGSMYSYDLTSATDRFPVEIQEIVMGKLYNRSVARHWKSLITKRSFKVDAERSVEYAVGQPMGLYSSWAVFALTHHAVVCYAAYLEGIDPSETDYYILGDDIVISNPKIATRYRNLMVDEAGVKMSPTKSIISVKSPLSAEFAKAIFLAGEEITPLPPRLLVGVLNDINLIQQLLQWARERYKYVPDFHPGSRHPLLDSFNNRDRRVGVILLTEFIGLASNYKLEQNLTNPTQFHQLLDCSVSRLQSNVGGGPKSFKGPWEGLVKHPSWLVALKQHCKLMDVLKSYDDLTKDWTEPVLTGPGLSRKDQIQVPCDPAPQAIVPKFKAKFAFLADLKPPAKDNRVKKGPHPFWWARIHIMKVIKERSDSRFEALLDADTMGQKLENFKLTKVGDPTGRTYQALPERLTKQMAKCTLKALKILRSNEVTIYDPKGVEIDGLPLNHRVVPLRTYLDSRNLPIVYYADKLQK